MADKFRVSGVSPRLDGEYEIDLGEFFNGDELHFIKQRSGVRAGELDEAFKAGDYDVILAMAVIAMRRAGTDVDPDIIWKAQVGKIDFVADEQEADAGPPASPPQSESGGRRSEDGENKSSGESSSITGDPPANGQSRTGIQASAIGAGSGQGTSAA